MVGRITTIRSTQKRKAARRSGHALQFLVVLLKTNPLIWRRIQVPAVDSFWDLHVAIQDAMGWQDYHLHEFRIAHPQRGTLERLGIPDPEFPEERPCSPDWEVPLAEYFNWESLSAAPPALYLYDFGDDWHHSVTFEDLLPSGAGRYPRCVAGARACPPEDCGGIHGFDEFLDAIGNPRHPDHAERVEWAGGSYNPEAFEPAQVVFDNPQQRWKKAFQNSAV